MNTRRLTKEDYYDLIITIYHISNYDKKIANLLSKYTIYSLVSKNYDLIYYSKLFVDLNIIPPEDNIKRMTEIQFKQISQQLEELMTKRDLTLFKVKLWDISNKGYYGH